MKENFNLLSDVKKLNFEISKVVKIFPNKERVLRDNFIQEGFNLLRNIYLTNNYNVNSPLRDKGYNSILTNIYMLDFFLNSAYLNRYISEDNFKRVNIVLRDVSKKTKGWINYGKCNNKTSV